MVRVYAEELQGRRNKYVTKYISEVIKTAFNKGLITLNDLYTKYKVEKLVCLASPYCKELKKLPLKTRLYKKRV